MVTVEMIAKLNRSKPTLGIIPTGIHLCNYCCNPLRPPTSHITATINSQAKPALHCSVAPHQTTDKDLACSTSCSYFGTAFQILFGVLAGFACLGTNSQPVTKLHTSHSAPPVLTSAHSAHHRHRMQVRSECLSPVPLHAPDQQVLFPGSDIGRLSDQQQQGTVLHLPEQDFGSAGQIGSTNGHLQQQQSGGSASQQGCGQMSQLFSQAEMLQDDLKAYAALVHEQKAHARYVQPEKSWQAFRMPNHCKEKHQHCKLAGLQSTTVGHVA